MGMSSSDARVAAKLLAAADRDGHLLDVLPASCCPATLTEAYVVQDLLVEELGLEPAGWKVGLTNIQAQRAKGLDHPVKARVFRTRMLEAPARIPAPVGRLMLEAEFLFKVAQDIRMESSSRDGVLSCVEAVHLGVELCASRFTPGLPLSVAANLADNSFHGGLVIGNAIHDWCSIDLSTVMIELLCDDRRVASGSGANVMGDPVNVLIWLANELLSEGRALRSGDWVATGSCTGACEVSSGTRARALFHGLGEVDVTVDSSNSWPKAVSVAEANEKRCGLN